MTKTDYKSIDKYIKTFPEETQAILEKVRQTVKNSVPAEAEEGISYQIPVFKLNGKFIVYFSGFKNHIGLYPLPKDPVFLKEIEPFIFGKGTVRFSLDKPIPYDLIARITEAHLKERF